MWQKSDIILVFLSSFYAVCPIMSYDELKEKFLNWSVFWYDSWQLWHDPEKTPIARYRPVNTFPRQPKHAPTSTIPRPLLGNSHLTRHATMEEFLEAVYPIILRGKREGGVSERERRRDCVCVYVCERERSVKVPINECPLESPPVEGEWPLVVRPLPSMKRRPHFKTCKSLGKNKNTVMGPGGSWNQDLLCWWGPAAI
jgi:hypothetical protein